MITLKMLEVVFKYTLRFFVILLTLTRCYECRQRSVLEGERIEFDFPYPCNSTEVTLQRSYGKPFYNSANPDSISSSNKIVTNHIQTNSDECYLHLVINPLSRSDEGTYVLIPYKNGVILQEYCRKLLQVDYPPGKASCKAPAVYVAREWVKLECEAEAGSLAGQIVCYQNGIRLPHLHPPQEYITKFSQNILARLSDSVYCCSSSFEQTIDICECKDWIWNFAYNSPITNIQPCASTSTTQSPSSSQGPTVYINTSFPVTAQPTISTQLVLSKMTLYEPLFILFFISSAVLLITCLVLCLKYKQKIQDNRVLSKIQNHFKDKSKFKSAKMKMVDIASTI